MHKVSRNRRRLCVALGGFLLPLSLAACSSSPSASSGPSTTVKSTSTTSGGSTTDESHTACALISPAQVKQTMGSTVATPKAQVDGSVTTCTYQAADRSRSVIIGYDTAATSTSFADDRSQIQSRQGPTTTISGLGNQAYSSSAKTGQETVNTVVTLQGSLQTIVTGTSTLAQVKSMAEEILYLIDAHNASTTSTTGATTSTTG
jgi:hypothetical protein